jgi:hypothetical protein
VHSAPLHFHFIRFEQHRVANAKNALSDPERRKVPAPTHGGERRANASPAIVRVRVGYAWLLHRFKFKFN